LVQPAHLQQIRNKVMAEDINSYKDGAITSINLKELKTKDTTLLNEMKRLESKLEAEGKLFHFKLGNAIISSTKAIHESRIAHYIQVGQYEFIGNRDSSLVYNNTRLHINPVLWGG